MFRRLIHWATDYNRRMARAKERIAEANRKLALIDGVSIIGIHENWDGSLDVTLECDPWMKADDCCEAAQLVIASTTLGDNATLKFGRMTIIDE